MRCKQRELRTALLMNALEPAETDQELQRPIRSCRDDQRVDDDHALLRRSACRDDPGVETIRLSRRSGCQRRSGCRRLASLTPPQLVAQSHLTRPMLAGEFT